MTDIVAVTCFFYFLLTYNLGTSVEMRSQFKTHFVRNADTSWLNFMGECEETYLQFCFLIFRAECIYLSDYALCEDFFGQLVAR